MSTEDKLIYSGITILFLAVLTCLGFAFRSDGAVTYCYIEAYSSHDVPKTFYKLWGYRSWRVNNTVGIFDNFDEAIKAADAMKCPMRK
jgi:hypothetical protein